MEAKTDPVATKSCYCEDYLNILLMSLKMAVLKYFNLILNQGNTHTRKRSVSHSSFYL